MKEPKLLTDREGLHLAFGAGAARGLVHIGILLALEKHQIPIASISGASMGALVGGSYAAIGNADEVAEAFVAFINSDLYNHGRYAFFKAADEERRREGKIKFKNFIRHGLMFGRSMATGSIIPFEEYRQDVQALIPTGAFEQTRLPFFAVSTELSELRETVFFRGYLRSAVMASCAIPGVFPAICSGPYTYIDGGWMNKIPLSPLLYLGARKILAVDASDIPLPEVNPRRALSVINRANSAAHRRLTHFQIADAPLIWTPPVGSVHWADFSSIDRLIGIGLEYGQKHIDQVKALLDEPPAPAAKWWRRFLPAKKKHECVTDYRARYNQLDFRGIWDVNNAANGS